jgi:hypothetical protein
MVTIYAVTFAADQVAFDLHLAQLRVDLLHEKYFVASAGYQVCVYRGVGLNKARPRFSQSQDASIYVELLSSQTSCSSLSD